MNLKNNLTRILSVLIVMIIAMTVYAVTALTNVTPEVTLTAVNYQGGEETSGFFEKDQNRAVFKNQYDKNSYYAYKSHNIMPRKITDINEKYKNSLFCLDNTLEFPQGNGIVYQNIGDLRTVKSVNTNQGEKNLTDEQKNKLFWLFENMYLREESKEVKESYKTELFKNTFIHTGGDANDSEKLELALRKYNVEVTEDDLAVIEQWVIWYIINGDDSFRLNGANMLLDSNKEIVPTTDKKQLRLNVYDYLKTNIDKNGNYKVKGNIPSNYSIFDQKALRYAKNDKNYSILKNIKFNLSNDLNIELKDVKINYLNKDNTLGKEISRSLMQVYLKSDESKEVKDSLKDVALKGEFGIKINEVMPENAHGLVITPVYDVKSINANVFIPKEENNKKVNQPIVNIERNKVTVNTPYGIPFKERESQKKYDLALRKSIVSIDGKIPEVSRLPRLDVSTDKNELLQNGKGTTITYKHPKNPLEVNIGSTVKYQIKVYNEETTEGIVTEIHDKLPSHLKLKENSELNKQYGWRQLENNVIATNYLNGKVLEGMRLGNNNNIIISQGYVEVELEVTDKATNDEILTNIASIAGQKPNSDRDSNPGNVKYPNDLPGYKGNPGNKNDLNDREYFYKGQEDDDDFEKVIVETPEKPKPEPKNFDLSLRKFINEINGKAPEVSREPKVDVTPLINKTATTAIYNHSKEPITVKSGDKVVYTLRVYNEGEVLAKVSEISDYIPAGLDFLPDDEINVKYGWKLEGNKAITKYLENTELKAFDSNSNNASLDYKDVKIALVVNDKKEEKDSLKNIGEIQNHIPKELKDRDSNPGNVKTKEYGTKNQEDDDDYEPLKKQEEVFDFTLKKFITHIESKDGKKKEDHSNRAPVVNVTPLKTGGTTAEYNHSKDPLLVLPEDRVVYTLRVYNEGNIDGYAEKIVDNVPSNLEFIESDPINVKYRWKKTENGLETDYLSRKASAERKENSKIVAFNSSKDTLAYKDVQVAFRISKNYKPADGIIKNIAEITEDWNEKGIPDRDSKPNNKNPKEDDEDYDQLKPAYFDLSLRKIVSKIFVIENGKTKTVNTNHKYSDSPEGVAKIELDRKKINKTEVKWEYKIRVTNEGVIPGYAKEVTDYIPEGTYFDPKDNTKDWYKKGEKAIATKSLANRLLKPGESAELTVYLRWKKDPKNMGVKTNWAEISEDGNEYGIPDRDSVPGNKRPHEDDIDDAPVALAIATGLAKSYIMYVLVGVTTLAVIVAISKGYMVYKMKNKNAKINKK